MIEAYFANNSEQRVERFLGTRAPRITESIAREMLKQMIVLSSHVATEHLSGRPGLRNITGTLRRAVLASPKVSESTRDIKGTVSTDPSVEAYARIQEYGGRVNIPEIVPRRAQALHFTIGGRSVFAKRVRAHSVTIPERSYMRSSLREKQADIVAGLNRAVGQAVNS